MSKHTPGPWKVVVDDTEESDWAHKWPIIQAEVGCQVVGAEGLYGDFETDMANARLIAAAPELLEALKLSRLGFEAMIEGGRCGETFVAVALTLDKINAAIAKAEGKQ